jgi:hypothetical protein
MVTWVLSGVDVIGSGASISVVDFHLKIVGQVVKTGQRAVFVYDRVRIQNATKPHMYLIHIESLITRNKVLCR